MDVIVLAAGWYLLGLTMGGKGGKLKQIILPKTGNHPPTKTVSSSHLSAHLRAKNISSKNHPFVFPTAAQRSSNIPKKSFQIQEFVNVVAKKLRNSISRFESFPSGLAGARWRWF